MKIAPIQKWLLLLPGFILVLSSACLSPVTSTLKPPATVTTLVADPVVITPAPNATPHANPRLQLEIQIVDLNYEPRLGDITIAWPNGGELVLQDTYGEKLPIPIVGTEEFSITVDVSGYLSITQSYRVTLTADQSYLLVAVMRDTSDLIPAPPENYELNFDL